MFSYFSLLLHSWCLIFNRFKSYIFFFYIFRWPNCHHQLISDNIWQRFKLVLHFLWPDCHPNIWQKVLKIMFYFYIFNGYIVALQYLIFHNIWQEVLKDTLMAILLSPIFNIWQYLTKCFKSYICYLYTFNCQSVSPNLIFNNILNIILKLYFFVIIHLMMKLSHPVWYLTIFDQFFLKLHF